MKLALKDLEALVEAAVAKQLPQLVAEHFTRASASLAESARRPHPQPARPPAKRPAPQQSPRSTSGFADLLAETRDRLRADGELSDDAPSAEPNFERLAFATPLPGRGSTVPSTGER